ncbi:DNA glycosylase AlkZ-like family protein [Yinghuangia sp. YIM S09857]
MAAPRLVRGTRPARHQLYDSAGNDGPTVWWNGEVVGAWAQRADGDMRRR